MTHSFALVRLALAILAMASAACSSPSALPPVVSAGRVSVAAGLAVQYRVHGNGPDTVVLVPGGPGLNADYLERSFGPLAVGRTVIVVDLRGRGEGAGVPDSTQLGLEHDVSDLELLRASLALGRMALVGHNWGAVVAASYAASHPDRVSRVVMLSPHLLLSSWAFQFAAYTGDRARLNAYYADSRARADSLDPQAFCRKYWSFYLSPLVVWDSVTIARGAPLVCGRSPMNLRQLERTNRWLLGSVVKVDLRERVKATAVPVLILAGGRDLIYSTMLGQWRDAMASSRLDTLDAEPHMPWLMNPERTFGDMDTFLHGQWPAGAR